MKTQLLLPNVCCCAHCCSEASKAAWQVNHQVTTWAEVNGWPVVDDFLTIWWLIRSSFTCASYLAMRSSKWTLPLLWTCVDLCNIPPCLWLAPWVPGTPPQCVQMWVSCESTLKRPGCSFPKRTSCFLEKYQGKFFLAERARPPRLQVHVLMVKVELSTLTKSRPSSNCWKPRQRRPWHRTVPTRYRLYPIAVNWWKLRGKHPWGILGAAEVKTPLGVQLPLDLGNGQCQWFACCLQLS